MLPPLTENAGRVYLLSGRGARFAERYRSLKLGPSEFQKLLDDDEHFLNVAPLVALALRENGGSAEANQLLALAETAGKEAIRTGDAGAAAQLARVYAVQGRRDEAISMLSAAISRNWLPQPPMLLVDLSLDPALASIKQDPRFQRLRRQVLATIARERARVDVSLLPQAKAA